MDILAIGGSPPTTNTLRAMLDGTGRSPEILWPACMEINHCIGCLKFKHDTPGKCFQDDNMSMAVQKMYEAQALVIASPTYFNNVPGPTKNFFARSVPTTYTGKGDARVGVD